MSTQRKSDTNAGMKGAYLFQGQIVAGDLPVTFHNGHWCFDPAPEAISFDAAILYDEADPDSAQIFKFATYRTPILGPNTFLRLLISKPGATHG